MRQEIRLKDEDRIAVIAPHPDDECLGGSSALILAPKKTDIFVLTDGSHGSKERSVEEEAVIRKNQFETEMEYVKPHSYTWIGCEDTKMFRHRKDVAKIDFTPYTVIFLPWRKSLHPDHRYAAAFCMDEIRRQQARASCYFYEINAPFYRPTHFIDITEIVEEKRRLIDFHKDQGGQENITLLLNAFRGAQMVSRPETIYAEAFEKVDFGREVTMTVEKEKNKDILIVRIIGSLDAGTSEQLRAELEGELDDVTFVRFDLKDMDYISSAGLRVILEVYQALEDRGGKVALDNVTEDLREIFEDTGFSEFMEMKN